MNVITYNGQPVPSVDHGDKGATCLCMARYLYSPNSRYGVDLKISDLRFGGTFETKPWSIELFIIGRSTQERDWFLFKIINVVNKWYDLIEV